MALTPGTRLGVYEVTERIGEGGMGQVYRAIDTRLKRQVAIKVLPPSFAADQDRLGRFQREAEVLASLNHPHIAAIYGLERSGDTTALVMELVEGVISHSGSDAAQFPSTRHCRSRSRSSTRSKPRTSGGSSIAISNPRTSKCDRTGP